MRPLFASLGLAMAVTLGSARQSPAQSPQPSPTRPATQNSSGRTLFDATTTQPQDWETGEGMNVSLRQGSLILSLTGHPFSWAASRTRFPVESGAQIRVDLAPGSAPAKVQAEWFSPAGEFMGTADASNGGWIQVHTDASQAVAEMRLKLWLEGDGAQARFRTLKVIAGQPRHETGIQPEHVYDGRGKLEPEQGLILQPSPDSSGSAHPIRAKLQGVQYSAVVLADRVNYAKQDTVVLDVAHLQGDISLQLLCWKADGTFLKPVDLLKNTTKTGRIEIPPSSYAAQVPPEAAQISFKLWLGGGTNAQMEVRSLIYGKLEGAATK